MLKMRPTYVSTRVSVAVCLSLSGALVALGLTASPVSADTRPAAGVPSTVSADALPTVQINGVVWKTAIVGTTAYAVGSFTRARPAGVAVGGAGEVARNNILAFDVATGALLPFAPALNAQALTVKPSPDGRRIYVGGDFTTVDGQVRSKIAAFDTTSGMLDSSFAPTVSAQVRAVAVTGSAVYVGGAFMKANGVARTRLAAFGRTDGALLPWQPTALDNQVEALAVSPSNASRVIVGGRFQTMNGVPQVGVGAVDAVSGATAPWSSRPVPTTLNPTNATSWVTDLQVQGDTVFGSADGEGGHWYDGRFAAKFDTGDLVWLDNCYGATYGMFPAGDTIYSVGHAHDCTSLGAFSETSPTTWHRTLAETAYPVGTDHGPAGSNMNYSGQPVPGLLHWFPTLGAGSYTGQFQAAWTVTGNANYLIEGGEFPSVNGTSQQGLVRFALSTTAPNKMKPVFTPALVPTAASLQAGTIRVSWPATWDADNSSLRYDLYRDFGTAPVYSLTQPATGWTSTNPSVPTGASMGFIDRGLAFGSSHSYRLKVSDPFGNNLDNMRSKTVTVTSTSPSEYTKAVLGDGATSFWRLGETGSTAFDYAGFNDATSGSGVTGGAVGAINADANPASVFDGTTNGFAATRSASPATASLTVEGWVKTTSTTGGKIIGYGSASAGTSSSYDRHVYMDNAGHIIFGVYNGGVHTVTSGQTYNDGQYHQVVATLDPTQGMTLYVDDKSVGKDPGTTLGQSYTGYWRIGGDNLAGWPNQPGSFFLAGTIDDVAIYSTALTPAMVDAHYLASGRTSTRP